MVHIFNDTHDHDHAETSSLGKLAAYALVGVFCAAVAFAGLVATTHVPS